MSHVALIACPNGFGHTRRLLCLAEQLIFHGHTVTLFASIPKASSLIKKLNITLIPHIEHFNPKISHYDWTTPDILPLSIFPNLTVYDFVVSDNLLDILSIRSDAFIYASFFWHRVFNGTPRSKVDYYSNIVNYTQTKFFASRLFAAPYIRTLNSLHLDPLFKPKNFIHINTPKPSSIILSIGKGSQLTSVLSNFLESIGVEASNPNLSVFIEPELYNSNLPSNFEIATYSYDMYARSKVAVVRPGVGTVTDCLLNSVIPFLFYEENNLEMINNSNVLTSLGLAYDCITIENAWRSAMTVLQNPTIISDYLNNLSDLDLFGESALLNFV